MALYEGRLFRPVLWLALLAVTMFSSGCRTTTGASLFTTSGPGWHVQEGQALWRPGRGLPELGGDLVMASHEDGRCAIEFAKTPLSLVSAQTTRTNWLIQFPAGRMSFTGRRQPPTRFAWLYLHTALGRGIRSLRRCILSANQTEAGGWKTPAREKPWKAFSRRESVPETLVVGLAHGGGRPRVVPAPL